MRIWILNHYASPPDRPAGTRHYEFGRVLAGQGHDVTIFASSFSHHSLREERLGRGERMRVEYVSGVRFIWIRTTPYSRNDHRRAVNMLSYAARVVLAQRRLERPDVVVGSSVHLAAVAAACVISRVRGTSFAFEVRDLWPQALIDMGELRERGVVARVLRGAERFLYRRAHVVISLLPGATEYIMAAGIPRERVVYVPNAINDLVTVPVTAASATGTRAARPARPGSGPPSSGLPSAPALTASAAGTATLSAGAQALVERIRDWQREGCLVAGYTGSHGLANGLPVLVEAARVLRDREVAGIALVFVGDGPAKVECERLAADYGLANVLFWPPVPKQAIPAVLDALDVALFALRDGSVARHGLSSNKLFDYLASARPVVSCCGVPEDPVWASGGGVCVPPQSPEAVADALVTLADIGEAGRRELGERGRRWVYQHHGVTALAERFLQALVGIRR